MAPAPQEKLSRSLGPFTVTMVGVGAMIGAGIFVLTGIAAGTAGPALVVAFAANGLVTFLTALAYAELGSAIPEAGGGYLWVKEGLPGPNAFLAGWMSWFAHAVAGSLYALGFGAYLALAFHDLGWHPFGLPPEMLGRPMAVAVALFFLAVNFKGVAETGWVGNVVTVAKIAILAAFVAAGLYHIATHPVDLTHFTPFMPEGFEGVLLAMGLTYVAFEGYEIIVQAGEEVRDPKRNIPRAVFWSLAIVIPVYLLVSVAAVGAVHTGSAEPTWQWLGRMKEVGLVEAARQFMPAGTALLLIGGLLSTMSALNATTFSSTRVAFAMGRDRNLPDLFARVHGRTRTPWPALLASGVLILTMVLLVPLEDVAAAADVMFLLLFLQVNLAIITIRRKYGDKLDYGFQVPFFPVTPVVAIALMVGIAVYMFRFSPLAWFVVAGWIGAGLVLYLTYGRRRTREKRASPVVLEARVPGPKAAVRILVPVANPESARALVALAAMVARARDGELVLLHVVTVPTQTPLAAGRRFARRARDEILDPAVADAEALGVPVSAVIRIARSPARGILDEIPDGGAGLVVMGWHGGWRTRATLGTNVDRVLQAAPCDVLVLKGGDLGAVHRVLVPVADPASARLLLDVADLFHRRTGATLDLLHVVPPDLDPAARKERLTALRRGLALAGDGEAEAKGAAGRIQVDLSNRVVDRIVAHSTDHDLTLVGASREPWHRKLVLGSKPEQVARRAAGRLILVKPRRGAVKAGILDTVEFFRSTEPPRAEA